MSNPADLSFQEREAALQTARSILETDQYGVLELNLQRLCWSGESMVLLARAAAMYCTQGPPLMAQPIVPPNVTLPGLLASTPPPTQMMQPPTPTQMMAAPTPTRAMPPSVRALGSGRLEVELPPGHVLGVIEAETSDGIPLAPDQDSSADDAQTSAIVNEIDDAPTSAIVDEAIVDEADDAQTGAVIDHTRPIMVDGKLSVVKRSVGFPIDGAGGHSRSGEM